MADVWWRVALALAYNLCNRKRLIRPPRAGLPVIADLKIKHLQGEQQKQEVEAFNCLNACLVIYSWEENDCQVVETDDLCWQEI